jgi:hypothetical protein
MGAKSAKSSEEPRSVIKKEQWEMPVSFDEEGKPISLRAYIEGGHNALSFSALSDDQRAELAAKRIEMQPDYEMATIDAGVIGKERAVDEVRTKTKLGRRLAQIETRVVMHLIDEAMDPAPVPAKATPPAPAKPTAPAPAPAPATATKRGS